MDDFEFRPITEGLGFRKKSTDGDSADIKTPNGIAETIKSKKKSAFPMSNMDFTEGAKSSPAQSKTFQPATEIRQSLVKVDPEIKSYIEQQFRLQPVSVIPAAIIFDSLVVAGLTCLFVVAVLLVANVKLVAILQSITSDIMVQASVGVLLLSVIALYTISFRSLCGWTLGEWAFDAQLGSDQEQESANYPFKVVFRMLLVAMTGFITLPILSMIMGRDLVGDTVGISLLRK